ncbi:MAG: hypothetical protein HDT13_11505 [Butyrivibrio sp.]|nr:hypothetical protein [Butyrivibrio sp.]
MDKKIYVCAAAMLCASVLAGCGDSPNQTDTVKQPQNNLLYEDAQGVWEENFDASLENGGKVKVSIDAEITKPSVKSVCVTEVAEFGLSQEYKETVLEQIFGASEIYLYDLKNMPEEQLVHHIADLVYEADMLSDEIESAYDRDTKERYQLKLDAVTKELEEYRSCLDTAPAEFIPAEDMSGDAFAGYWDGIMYAVYFQNYLNENPGGHRSGIFNTVKPDEIAYPVRNQSIIIEPVDMGEVAPESIRHATKIEPNDMYDFEGPEGNSASQEIADRFIQNLGINGVIYDYIHDDSTGKYVGGSGRLIWRSSMNSADIDGYYFNYSIALDTENNVKAYEHDAVYNRWGDYADASNPQYSRRSSMTVYVKGQRVIYAEINNPLEVISINERAEVLSFDIIKDIIRSELSDNIQNYISYEISDGMAVRFQGMQFGYVRLRDEKRGDLYSYVPAWMLYGRNGDTLEWGAENMIIINAIDGTPIYVKDLV